MECIAPAPFLMAHTASVRETDSMFEGLHRGQGSTGCRRFTLRKQVWAPLVIMEMRLLSVESAWVRS